MFAFFGSTFIIIPPIQSLTAKNVEQCASFCLEDIKCLSFDFLKLSKCNYILWLFLFIITNTQAFQNLDCFLNSKHISQNGTESSSSSLFEHYSSNNLKII